MTGVAESRPRVLVVAYCFPPHAAIGTHRTLRLVSHLVDRGWQVDILTARPRAYLPSTPVDDSLLSRVPGDVRVVRSGALRGFTKLGRFLEPFKNRTRGVQSAASTVSNPSDAKKLGIKVLLEELWAMPDKDVGWLTPALLRAVPAFATRRPDVIFSSAPPWTTHLVAGSLASLFRCPWVADFRDPWVRSPWTRYRTNAAVAIARRLESAVVRKAATVLFTTNAARHEFAEYYGPEAARKFQVVTNGCDPTELGAPESVPSDGPFLLLHAGTLYGGRSPVPLLRALASLRRSSVSAAACLRLRFLGSTGFPGVDLPAMCRALGLQDVVEFLPRVDRVESLREMRRASALVILQGGTAMAIPGKLYEYLAAGRPLLALGEPGEMTQLVRAHRLGVTALPGDVTEIERALATLLAWSRRPFTPARPSLYDGRLRAAEMAAILERVIPARVPADVVPHAAADGSRRA